MDALAINGGKPVRDSYISYGKQTIDDKDIDMVIKVLKGDYLTTGPTVSEFEKKVANYVGAKYAVAVSNGTAALHMACYAAGIKSGDEVLVPAITFAASANCVLYCGGKPVFIDIDEKTYNMDIDKIEEKITSKTKAIIPVDFTGQSVDMDRILEIARKYNLVVIEDAAHALGSEYKGQKIGVKADMTEFSFHPVKPITTAEGGIIVTNDKNLYEKMLLFRTHGITRNEKFMNDNQGPWYYEQIDLGYNYRITDMQCALGISQMDKIDSFVKRRRDIVNKYNETFGNLKEVIIPYEAEYSNSGWHIYVIALNLNELTVGRKEVFEALQKENIGVNVHYLPVYMHPYYKSIGYKEGICPIAEDLYNKMITLPLFPSMTDKDVEDVITAVNKVIDFYRK
ncbi:UDP-4-amino-4,6-dideoxy-N-acetyl-beta-L-altrosamine transaminase [Clostridium septicum]|uniref:UDP-4-amino-4, 6-dideoxy-N-acetyl-beta-L-altrosamine transaminase n=1 Tax=Clostridium septicum TaxID=1504 RepID=A0A9N7PL22_CLOSE|nr:UDP-4-amino-4,6-dideoxy-N-acetyl-beta-L-altrosamine transaminase [Clostridium septicum]AYE34872.1 UDP-4-amino-4,6-dideoxy-N-acetyl-beta-L-altrosamine transaminase [Clostridium septicum]QAS60267.1 UDP-4-amino-4,6-dideoxy-N-acetyl-beta-L-altrosamine transaminase [Clostridium septicum]UEC20478.1 UDP-4-amino-4,6-dideoxy-N-acetyl-beta-L-altrosamine transaminase [Clostridium septicum]USS01466.1 UDP-4-amino-4,6-dideoxy-N-acetyl-beta-L-altrosamine transaminase [Clostridium septicum]